MSRVLETAAWMCLCAALIAVRTYPDFHPVVGNDSFQYLSVAANALDGRVGYTSLVHFDAERSFGTIPAPIVTFPIGYSLAVAAVALPGLSLEMAALIVSAAATLGCIALLAWMCGALGLSRSMRNIVLFAFVFNAAVIYYAGVAASEAAFTFLVVLGAALLVRAHASAGPVAAWHWAAAGLAFGLSYHVRYAGLFFIVGLGAVALWHLVRRRVLFKGHLIALTVAIAALLPGVIRNVVLVGNWRGGNEKTVSNALSSVLAETARAANHLFLGPGQLTETGLFRVLFTAAFGSAIVYLAWRFVRCRGARPRPAPHASRAATDLLLISLSYTACMFYAGLTTVISYGTRMFVPLLPLLLLLFGFAVDAMVRDLPLGNAGRKAMLVALTVALFVYASLNLAVVHMPLNRADSPGLDLMTEVSDAGKAARVAVRRLTGESGVIVATDGQAIGYVLGRRTVSLVGPQYSTVEWTEAAVRETTRRFKAAAIVIYVPSGEEWKDDDFVPSSFVRALALGEAPPWLEQVHVSSEARVYAVRSP